MPLGLNNRAIPMVLTLIAGGLVMGLGLRAQPPLVVMGQPASAPPAPPAPATPADKNPAPTKAPPAPGGKAPAKPAAERMQGVRNWGVAEPIAKPKNALRLATYNIENLYRKPETGEAKENQPPKAEDACAAVAEAIKRIDADVIGLQEIESEATLKWFREQYLKGLGYDQLASIDAGDDRGIEQAVLSRFPIKDAKNWPKMKVGGVHPAKWGREANPDAGKEIQFARSPLRVTIEAPSVDGGQPIALTLFVVHHKSGGPGNYWREKEAAKVVELVKDFEKDQPGAMVAVLGDFNAQPNAESVLVYSTAGLLDAFGDRTMGEPKFMTHSSGRAIDYIFLSKPASERVIRETRFILGTADRPVGTDWRTTPNPIGWASDHYPVVIDLKR
jgi:endonuclease/exonuclease/phosphatase family metal-dependent hydrolase